MRKLRFRPPVRLDVPGDNWPVYPILPLEGGGRLSRLQAKLFLGRGRRRVSSAR